MLTPAHGLSIPVREGWYLVCTCPSNPEQYELLDHRGEQKAYLRLRWGCFSVTCPGPLDAEAYFHEFEGDGFKGSFDTDEERVHFLNAAVDAVEQWWRRSLLSSD